MGAVGEVGCPLCVVLIILTAGLSWILISLLLGTQSGFSRFQQLLSSPENPPTAVSGCGSSTVTLQASAGPSGARSRHNKLQPRRYKCGLPQPCPEQHLTFLLVSGAANKICLEDKMLMSSVTNNVGRGLNIALVNGVNGELIDARSFDMWAGYVNELPKFIRTLHGGTLVFVAS
ncbi:protein FAM3A-like [Mauremys mutica]|uniref:protein FAM3A-like n=1 Tax=Mauremys mutica TaxID=74926 RepID=UPI001D13FF44|nr:protein FAM3A-like [Mauremys mutica]